MLTLEPQIVARLQAQVPALATVASRSWLAGAEDISPQLPAAYVQPGATQYLDLSDDGSGVEIEAWQIVVCVPFLKDQADLVTAATLAGPLLQAIAAALHGWAPDGSEYSSLQILERGQPSYDEGFAQFPMTFRATRAVVDAEPS